MGEEVEPLENHSHLPPHFVDVDSGVSDAPPRKHILPAVVPPEVEAAEEGALAGNRRGTDDHHYHEVQ